MREILFRGKRVDTGEWVEGLITHDIDGSLRSMEVYSGYFLASFYDVEPSTVGQYTSLTDKNGKRIFEDDVVRLYPGEEYEKTARVIMAKGCWILEFKDYWDFLVTNLHHLEVIGNIHDNPELLKEA